MFTIRPTTIEDMPAIWAFVRKKAAFDDWLDEQKRKAEEAARGAQQTVSNVGQQLSAEAQQRKQAFDDWLAHTWAPQWGQKNDVQVKVDHINNTLLPARAQAEVAAKTRRIWSKVPVKVAGVDRGVRPIGL